MNTPEKSFQAAHEVGKVYDAITDSKVLVEFFLTTLLKFIPARQSFLFLATKNKTLLLEAAVPSDGQVPESLTVDAQRIFDEGKPCAFKGRMFLPLIARNSVIGVACFERSVDAPVPGAQGPAFSSQDIEIGFDLASQCSGALKNILLFEENLKMERLAAVGQAMGMVIHEIKNIMQLARFSDEITRMGIKEKNEKFLEKGLAKMSKTLKEMDGFIGEMLSLTKDYQLEPEKVDLPAILAELQGDLAERAEGYHIRLDFKADPGFPLVEGDGRSIYRALLNLVKNAFEAFQDKPHSPSENSKVNGASPNANQFSQRGNWGNPDYHKGKENKSQDSPGNLLKNENGSQGKQNACVTVRARIKDDDHYELVVGDNACGMSEEVKAKLFEAFFSTKGKRGTGLGLMVVARAAKMHQGTVRVESQIGKGTQFILTLPRAFVDQK